MCKSSSSTKVTKTEVPEYVNQLGQNLVGQTESLAAQPYEPYTGERVAPTTGDQQTAFQQLRDVVGNAPTVLPQALAGVEAYANAPGATLGGVGLLEDAVTSGTGPLANSVAGASQYANAPAQSLSALDAIRAYAEESGDPEFLAQILRMAEEYGKAPAQQVSTERIVDEGGRLGAISDYMNPYLDEALAPAMRQIEESINRAQKRVGAMATTAGAFGDARHGILEGEVYGQGAQAMGDTASKFYKDAFDAVMGLRGADLNRFGQVDLANAGFNEQALQRLLSGAQAMQGMSTQDQQNELERLRLLLSGDTAQAGLNEQALQRMLTGSGAELDRSLQAFNALLAGQGAQAGLDEQALQRMLTGSTALVNLPAADQARVLQAIQALAAGGTMQQTTDQAGLDAEYQEFLREYGHDFSILDAMSSALGAAAGAAPKEKTETLTEPDNSGMALLGALISKI